MFNENGASQNEFNDEDKIGNGLKGNDAEQGGDVYEHWTQIHERWNQEERTEQARIIRRYGPFVLVCNLAIGSFVFYHNRQNESKIVNSPNSYVDFAAEYVPLTQGEINNLKQKLRQIQPQLPKAIFVDLQAKAKTIEGLRSKLPTKPKISEFGRIGVDLEDLEPVFDSRFFPAGTLEGNISQISYEDKAIIGSKSAVAAMATYRDNTGNLIIF